ncbi:50S ribosomal protein L1 [Candidatus Saccharimonas aalborgensis]|jgi:large subunit ribosomal protein L1|uniref:Large ribosomal subunit protein uL1 n=1 Tax=Candidatus Saccharimonas aalborgensis TaxID=1332188 RepID=R4PLX9_9BACT|nr:50S ribosomal protein L1 [Candidatus Saccharimonas aalborgensis]
MSGGDRITATTAGDTDMAKKAELIEEAAKLKIEVPAKATIADLESLIADAKTKKPAADKEVVAERKADVAKAGKRSEKALEEAEEKAVKEARKEAHDTSAQGDAVAHEKKGPAPKVRPLIERRGKKFQAVAKLVEVAKVYTLAEALELATKTNPSKFDASVEVHVRLGVDPRQADQNIRATVTLPNGTGKTVRVAVFAPEAEHDAAKKAGADIVGDETFLKQLDKGEIAFDTLVSTPAYMPRLGKYARLLGPKGLMPNPKSGTVAADVAKAVTEAKAGKVEYRVDKQATIHLSIGKVSFGANKLEENARAFFGSLQSQKPSSLKGIYVKSTAIATTMGPGIKVENQVN